MVESACCGDGGAGEEGRAISSSFSGSILSCAGPSCTAIAIGWPVGSGISTSVEEEESGAFFFCTDSSDLADFSEVTMAAGGAAEETTLSHYCKVSLMCLV